MSLTSLPTFPTLQTHHYSLQVQPSVSTTLSKFGTNLLSSSTDASVIAAATEAVAHENVVSTALGIGKEWPFGESENGVVSDSSIGIDMRRKKRRKRRKNLGCVEEQNHHNNFLTEKDKLCLCLKDEERTEVAKQKITELEGSSSAISRVLCNTRESRETLIRDYRWLVASIASGYQGKGLTNEDLIQGGTIGLLHGAEKFDPNRGCKLSTYVYWWIKQAIIKAVAKKSRLIRLPGYKSGMVAKLAEANNVLSRKLRRKPTYDEMAEVLNVNVSTVKLVFEKSRTPISLDKTVTDRGNLSLKEIIAGPIEIIPEKMFERKLVKQGVVKLLNTLTKREAEIFILYFGLNGETPRSFEEIGKVLKLSRERIRQIYGIALLKLQQNTLVDSLKFYVV